MQPLLHMFLSQAPSSGRGCQLHCILSNLQHARRPPFKDPKPSELGGGGQGTAKQCPGATSHPGPPDGSVIENEISPATSTVQPQSITAAAAAAGFVPVSLRSVQLCRTHARQPTSALLRILHKLLLHAALAFTTIAIAGKGIQFDKATQSTML